jgi:hypothetical protein
LRSRRFGYQAGRIASTRGPNPKPNPSGVRSKAANGSGSELLDVVPGHLLSSKPNRNFILPSPKRKRSEVRGCIFSKVTMVLGRGFSTILVGLQLGSPTPRPAFEDMAVVQETVEHRGDRGAVAEQVSPVFHWANR